MRLLVSAESAQHKAGQGLCARCAGFVSSKEGIRGPGRRHFYTPVGKHLRDTRCGSRIAVTRSFFGDVTSDCLAYAKHIVGAFHADVNDLYGKPEDHVAQLPPWVGEIAQAGDLSLPITRATAVRMCPSLLGVSPRTVY